MIFVPGPSGLRWAPFGQTLRRKLWEWHTGWLGLGLSLALSFVLTQGMKNLFGKPRPDLLSRCNPDYENQAEYALDSFAGLTYLALYLASKFSITVPYLLPFSHASPSSSTSTFANSQKPTRPDSSSPTLPAPSSSTQQHQTPLRSQSAAPPVYLLLLPFIPICLAIYISSTRYSDFRHHGFDILFGSLMGAVLSWFSFRMYHLPIRRGGGWSWGPRSEGKAFGTLLGTGGYRETGGKRDDDVLGQRGDLEWGKGPTEREGVNSQGTTGEHVNGTVEPSTSVR
ncbi:MAG: hypothetical protein L6R42_010861 [Xanthoria sp. 1 TBL-2021]|nr:MAG: hypothetical protein L6R42_010861 [Xanthoria sp. 1 TBL-2021]